MTTSSEEPSPEECRIDPTAGFGYPAGVRAVERTARPLLTLGPTAALWSGGKPPAAVSQAIVRLAPPMGTTAAQVEEAAARCREAGAVAVKLVGGAERMALAAEAAAQVPAGAPRRTVRQVVGELVDRAQVDDREALRKLVEEALERGEERAPAKVQPSAGPALYVQKLILRNWIRFRGVFELVLAPLVYGITAAFVGNAERSNWLGKSSFLNALAFALYGWTPESIRAADDWITRGEKEGGVELHLSDGTVITRWRRRGASTQLTLTGPDRREANQDAAQAQIVDLLGLTEQDFFATSFFEQRACSRLVRARPAERLEIVHGWLDLEPLVQAELWAQGELQAAIDRERAVVVQQDRERGMVRAWASTKEELSREQVLLLLAQAAADAASERDGWQEAAREAEQVEAAWEVRQRDARQAARASVVRDEIRKLQEQLAALGDLAQFKAALPGLLSDKQAAAQTLALASTELRQKKQLAAGTFDGCCPVAGITCPVKADINADRQRNSALLREADKAHADALAALMGATRAHETVDGALRRAEALSSEIAAAERELEALREAEARVVARGAQDEEPQDPQPLWKAANDAEQRRRSALTARERIVEAWAKLDALEQERQQVQAEIATLRAAVQLLGKGGAQKAIAVAELASIEVRANEALRGNGIDLGIAVRWGRESSTQLASVCETCGAAFGSGRSVKVCGKCGAARGPKVSDKLDVELTDRSGAAEDLAGLALQLAASDWLRERRGARWAVVGIDEPFGALDPAHVRALSTHLAGMLRSRRVQQGFVIAHTTSAMDALPGRVRVIGKAQGSRVEVEG